MSTPTLRASRPVPDGHPARILLERGENIFTSLDLTLTGGWTDPTYPTLTRWQATFICTRYVFNVEAVSFPVATMELTVVNPNAGSPVSDLHRLDQDSGELAAALFFGQARTVEFDRIAPDHDGRPVLLIDTYEVTPSWRGTDLTVVMALRVLAVFANLGIEAAALSAAPIAEEMTVADRDRIGALIAQMWSQLGFARVPTRDVDGLDNRVLGLAFDHATIQRTLAQVIGEDPLLVAAAGR